MLRVLWKIHLFFSIAKLNGSCLLVCCDQLQISSAIVATISFLFVKNHDKHL
jgi:hypothetical protein